MAAIVIIAGEGTDGITVSAFAQHPNPNECQSANAFGIFLESYNRFRRTRLSHQVRRIDPVTRAAQIAMNIVRHESRIVLRHVEPPRLFETQTNIV